MASDMDDIPVRRTGFMATVRNTLVGILIGLLVLAFAVWGVNDVFSPNRTNAVLKVGDAEVTRTEFRERYQRALRDYAERNGEGMTNQQAYDRGLPQQLLGEFQQRLAIESDANDLGVGVNRRDARDVIAQNEVFQNPVTGEFDELQYETRLRGAGLSKGDFEAGVIDQLRQAQTLPAIMGGIQVPRDYAERYNTFVNEIRRARLVRFDENALDTAPTPTDEQLQTFIEANAAQYMAPQYRRVIVLRREISDFNQQPPADVSNEDPRNVYFTVEEDEIRAQFDTMNAAGRFGASETRSVTVLSVPTQLQANTIAERINAGEDAGVVATELNLPDPEEYDNIARDGLFNRAAADAAFAAEIGEAAVAPTGFGTFEVVIVRAVQGGSTVTFEDKREEVLELLLAGRAQQQIADIEKVVDDMRLEGKTLEEIAEAIQSPLSEYPFIDRTGTTQDGTRLAGFSAIPGIAADDKLLTAIFTADIGYESEITATSSNGLAIFRVTDVIEPRMKTLDEVRDQATAAWRAEQINDALTDKAVALTARLRDGEDISAIAAELEASVEPLILSRAQPPRDVGPAVVLGLFDGEVGKVVRGPGATPGTYEIAVLDDVSASSERVGGELLNVIRDQLSEQLALDVSQAYEQAILSDHPAQVFDDMVRNTLGLEPTTP